MSKINFIKDEEIQNLHSDDDLLETKKYSYTLKEMILHAETPFTIGLFGEWGSGKSSIVNSTQNELEKDETCNIKFIKYDAWKYANDSFRRMFLKTVQEKLGIEGTSKFESFYVDKNTTTKIDKKINISFLLISLMIVSIGLLSVFFLPPTFSTEWKITIPLLIAVIGLSISIARNFFDSYKITIQNPKIFAPEQFEEIFDEMITSSMNIKQMAHPKKWIKKGLIENKIDKLIIIVDNIDRCDKETAYELLTNIKNFLERKGIIFVVPIDDSALRRHLHDINNEDNKEADEFLRKFFNTTLKIKHFQSRDLFIFTNELNKKHNLNLQPDTIDIIAKEYATNPRRIIQFLNNLTAELNVIGQKYEKDFVTKYETLIAQLLIIREEWADVFKLISNKPHLLKRYDNDIFKNNDYKLFIDKTKAIFTYIDIKTIEKLISNIDNDIKVSNEIIELLDNNKYDELKPMINKNNIFEELLLFILEDLRKEIERETFKLGAFNRFTNLLKLNYIICIPININKKFNRDFKIENILKIINNLNKDDFDSFYKFVNDNQKQGLKSLETTAINKFKETWKEVRDEKAIEKYAKIWTDGLENYINHSTNIEKIKELAHSFLNYYIYYPDLLLHDEDWINKDKLQYIIDSQFINYILNHIEPTLDNENFNELLYISKLKLVDIQNIENLFEKIIITPNTLYDTSNAQEATTQFQNQVFSNLNKIVNLLENTLKKHAFKSEKITNYLKFLNQNHSIQYKHPSYPNGQHTQTANVNIINTLDEKHQIELLKLYYEIYRATANYTDTTSYIKTLINKYPNLQKDFFTLLIQLRDTNNYHLQSLFDYLISFETINEDLFNLYEQLFIQDENDKDKIIEKLDTLIRNYLDNKNEIISNFLIIMLKYQSTKEIITNIVVELSTEDITQLPKEIQSLTYEYLCETDKIFELESKIDFIKEVLAFGNQYKDCIVKIIVSKLQEKSKVEGALEILKVFSHPSKEQKSKLYTALKTQEKHDKFSKEVKNLLKKYEDK